MTITLEAIRAAGGIVHSDGNIFFRDISMLQGLAGAAPAAVAGPVLDVTLDEDQAGLLRDMLGDHAEYPEAITVRLMVGDGHSGLGLYVAQAEYQDEGAVLLASLPAPAAPSAVAGRTVPRNDDERAAAQFFADNPSAALLAWPLYLARDKSPALEAPAAKTIAEAITNNFRDAGWSMPSIDTARVLEAVKSALGPAAAPQAPAAPSDWVAPVRELLGHLSNVLGDEAFAKIDTTRWNAVSALIGTTQAAPAAPAVDALSQAARDVLAERARQVNAEGFSHARDDQYVGGQLAGAAASYLILAAGGREDEARAFWPWRQEWLKPSSQRRYLEKACALGLAEMERMDRSAALANGGNAI